MIAILPVREYECTLFCCLLPGAFTTLGQILLPLPVRLNSALSLVANLINVS